MNKLNKRLVKRAFLAIFVLNVVFNMSFMQTVILANAEETEASLPTLEVSETTDVEIMDEIDVIENPENDDFEVIENEENNDLEEGIPSMVFATTGTYMTLEVCKVILNEYDEVVSGTQYPGATFTIPFTFQGIETFVTVNSSDVETVFGYGEYAFGAICGEKKVNYDLPDIGLTPFSYSPEIITGNYVWDKKYSETSLDGGLYNNSDQSPLFWYYNEDDFSDGYIPDVGGNRPIGFKTTLFVVNKFIEEKKPIDTTKIYATKIVCNSEDLLPNWGNKFAQEEQGEVITITANTADEFLAGKDKNCWVEKDWDFQYKLAYDPIQGEDTQNPGDNVIGGVSGWTTFNGATGATIVADGNSVWVREVMKPGYLGFSGDLIHDINTPHNNVSAEMYCYDDVWNYDNFDLVKYPNVKDGPYHCIAFNVLLDDKDDECKKDCPEPPQSCPAIKNNIIINGSFEDPIVTHEGGWDIYETVSGWTVEWREDIKGEIKVNPQFELHNSDVLWNAKGGKQYIELDSDWYGPDGSGFPYEASVKISQEIDTIPGKKYKVEFWFSGRPGEDASQNIIISYINDVEELEESIDSTHLLQTVWNKLSYSFTATSEKTIISFADGGIPNSHGTFLDCVSVFEDDNGGNGGGGGGGGGGSSGGGRSGGGTGGGFIPEGEILGATSCVQFRTYNSIGNAGGEIRALQTFLNEYMNAGLIVDGVYGWTTAKAVHDFQAYHWREVIDPWTPPLSPNTTGWQYKTTRATINAIIDCPEAPVFLEDPMIMYQVLSVEDKKPLSDDQIQKVYDLLIQAQGGQVSGQVSGETNVNSLTHAQILEIFQGIANQGISGGK